MLILILFATLHLTFLLKKTGFPCFDTIIHSLYVQLFIRLQRCFTVRSICLADENGKLLLFNLIL